MVCELFGKCINQLKVEHIVIKTNPKKNGRKSTKKGEKIIVGYPCKEKARMEKCVAFFEERSKAKCFENGKSYILDFEGRKIESLCMHVDGGIIDTSEQIKCDYVIFVKDCVGRTIFVELKGKNTKHAVEQMLKTIETKQFRDIQNDKSKIYGRIVHASGVPRIQSTDSFMALKEVLMKSGGNLKCGEYILEEKYRDLDM